MAATATAATATTAAAATTSSRSGEPRRVRGPIGIPDGTQRRKEDRVRKQRAMPNSKEDLKSAAAYQLRWHDLDERPEQLVTKIPDGTQRRKEDRGRKQRAMGRVLAERVRRAHRA